MKALKKLNKKYKDSGLLILSISVDDSRTAGKVESFIRTRKYPCTVLMDTNKEAYDKFHVTNVPQMFLLDTAGNIVYSHFGYRKGDVNQLETKLKDLLVKKAEVDSGEE